MNKILIKKRFHNTYLDRTGVEIIGERGSGKSLQLVLEALLNDGIFVTNNIDVPRTLLENLKIDSTNIRVMTYNDFRNATNFNMCLGNTPIYIDEIGVFQKQYDLPASTYKNVCGYTADIIGFDNRFMIELGNKNMFEEI